MITLSLYAIAINKQYRFVLVEDINTLGLLVGYIASLTNLGYNLIGGMTHLMKSMSAVERLREYAINKKFEFPWYILEDGTKNYDKYRPVPNKKLKKQS